MKSRIFALVSVLALMTTLVHVSYAQEVAPIPARVLLEDFNIEAPDISTLDYDIMPIAASNFIGLNGTTPISNSSNLASFVYYHYTGNNALTQPAVPLTVGIPVSIASGSKVTVKWSGFSYGRRYESTSENTMYYGYAFRATPSSGTSVSVTPTFSIRDGANTQLASASSVSGSVTFTASSDITFIGFCVLEPSYSYSKYQQWQSYVNVSSASITVTYSNPSTDALLGIAASSASTALTSKEILSVLQSIASNGSSSQPSAMQQFEDKYLEKMEPQLSQIEDMMSPANTALPNGGDFAGFVSDVQDGLGVNGSSFNASEFADATSKFGSKDATGPGGPWEFFSQSVVDSLAGDAQVAGLSDDDYIYAWLEETQRRYGMWNSSNP